MHIPPEPLVSVIIPLYNRIDLIKETLLSVQAQTYTHWETIIVDDGSTDGSRELVEEIARQEDRFKVFRRHQAPKGPSACRNIGIQEALGDYLVFLDSDDLLAPSCIAQRMAVFRQHPSCAFIVFPMLLFSEETNDLNLLWNQSTEEDDLARFLRGDAVWQTTGPIYQASAFLELRGFQENLSYWEDYELHIRALCLALPYKKYMHLPPDCYYRKHDSALSQSSLPPETLIVMAETYKQIHQLAQENEALTSHRTKQMNAMFFTLSINQIASFKDIVQGLATWNYGYHEKLLSHPEFITGYFCLSFKFLETILRKYAWIFRLSYKLTIRLMPKIYWRDRTTLHKISYRSAYRH